MRKSPAEALVEIARSKAEAGESWDALTAQLSADSYVLADVMATNPKALLDAGPAWKLQLDSGSLKAALAAYREQILGCAAVWDLDVPLRKKWASLDPMSDAVLEASGAGAFSYELTKGHDAAWLIRRRDRKAAQLRLLAERIIEEQPEAGLRCLKASDYCIFLAHHARESLTTADPSLAIVRTAVLLGEYAVEDTDPDAVPADTMDAYRQALTWATVTGEPIQWPEPYFN